MRRIQDPLYKMLKEPVVVLRRIPANEQDSTIDEDHVFGSLRLNKRKFRLIIDASVNLRMAILPAQSTLDPEGIPVIELDYNGTLIPPNGLIMQDDVIVRTSKDEQELYVYRTKQVLGIQLFDFVNRDKVTQAGY